MFLNVSIADRWNWHLDHNSGYFVCSVYYMLTADNSQVVEADSNLIWHRQVPAEVSIMAWRLLRNRLLTKSNLLARRIISLEAQRCVTGCGEVETTQHLFVSCAVFSELWSLVRQWIGVYEVDPLDINQHFIQFIYLSGGSTKRRFFMQLV